MNRAISILLVILLALCFASIEGNAQEERLESAPPLAPGTPASVSQPSYSHTFYSSIPAVLPGYSNIWLTQPGAITNYQFQYPWLPKGVISNLSLYFDDHQPDFIIDDEDQTQDISIIASGKSLDIVNTYIPYKNDKLSYLILPIECSENLRISFLSSYPLIL